MNILVSWIGLADLKAALVGGADEGPIANALTASEYDVVVLLTDRKESEWAVYEEWLREKTGAQLRVLEKPLSSPTAYREIFLAARDALDSIVDQHGSEADMTFHLSPGTSAMASIWMILAQMGYRASLIHSSRETGVSTVDLPFDLTAEFLPARAAAADAELASLSSGKAPRSPAFEEIVYDSEIMRDVIGRAQKVAPRSITVLIEGESGTGKELFARAIHKASARASGPFVTVNCGAIVAELMESEFFGHKKGSFTGAAADRKGHFQQADGGTLFLDEIGDLPLNMQVKLLRALQESVVVPVGASDPIHFDVRIISATNRSLVQEVTAKRFREDLFYRLAVAVIRLPPLRDRSGDLGLLVDSLTETLNRRLSAEAGWKHKKLSVGAKKIVLEHRWQGNVRELMNTLTRAMVWANGAKVTSDEMSAALMDGPQLGPGGDDFLDRSVENGIDIQELIGVVEKTYVVKALDATRGNKTKAAELLSLGNYQTLTNWMKKHGITYKLA